MQFTRKICVQTSSSQKLAPGRPYQACHIAAAPDQAHASTTAALWRFSGAGLCAGRAARSGWVGLRSTATGAGAGRGGGRLAVTRAAVVARPSYSCELLLGEALPAPGPSCPTMAVVDAVMTRGRTGRRRRQGDRASRRRSLPAPHPYQLA